MERLLRDGVLSADQIATLVSIVGKGNLWTEMPERLVHSRDMWPRSVLWTKKGFFPHPPDVVVAPASALEVADILRFAANEKLPVIPYGAGSGVCAGTLPLRGGVIVSLKRMNRLIGIDTESLIAEIEPGIYGEILERRLKPLGYTMGHYPSSIYCSTLGGWLAARGAGQVSSRYGKIEDMVAGLEFVLPDGSIHRTQAAPTAASSIDWNQILIGSEGTLGIITRAWMRVHPWPKKRTFQSYYFQDVPHGLDVMRQVMQAGVEPAVLRLYDEFDTLVASTHGEDSLDESGAEPSQSRIQALAKEAFSTLKKRSLKPLLAKSGWVNRAFEALPGRCLLVILTEGEPDLAEHDYQRIREICRKAGAKDGGERPARYWLEHRHDVSYKQSKIFDADSWVDTMEVATTWEKVADLYSAVRRAVSPHAFIMAHFSHAYRDGCCIYFSFASTGRDIEAQERMHARVWDEALAAVHKHEGTITHHHGVGMSKGHMLPLEYGQLWPLWRRVKHALDPNGIMNPGKLGERDE